jgi:uncharacterized phage protein (TIGR02218 family)
MTYDAREKSRYSGRPVECYRFTQGVNQYLYTSADQPITLASGTYNPEIISRTPLDQSAEQSAGNSQVSLPRDNAVAKLFIAYLPISPVALTIFRVHFADGEVKTIFTGKITTSLFQGAQATLTAAPISAVFKKQIPGTVYQSQCNHALYSPGCTVDKNSFKVAGVITVVSGADVQAAAFASKPDGWFNNGWLERSNGDVRFIMNHVGSTLSLMSVFPGLAASETLKAYAGCQRTEAICASKFSNLVNFLGFTRIPTKNPYGNNGVV